MDALDLRILATMGYVPWNPTAQDPDRLRPSAVAERLDVSPETIRERLSGLEEAGVVDGWEAYPNPRHLDLSLGGWIFSPPSRDHVVERLDEILLVDGVLEVFTYRGPFVSVALAFESEHQRDRRLDLVSSRLADADPIHLLDPPVPKPAGELDRTDWAIVQALRGQARRPLSEVADAVDKSYRTVKRRFDRMTEGSSLYIVPRVDLSRVAGLLPFTLAVRVQAPPREVASRLQDAFGERLLHRLVPPSDEAGLLVVGLYAETVAEMEQSTDRAADLEGVESASSLLSAGRHQTGWLDEQIDARTR